MLRRLLVAAVIIAILGGVFVGCGSKKIESKKSVQISVGEPYTLDYKTTDKSIDFYTQSDSMEMLIASTPFYFGANELPGGNGKEYEKARAAKIVEILKETDTLLSITKELDSDIELLRNSYLSYLSTCLKKEPELLTFAKESSAEIIQLKSNEAVVRAAVESITDNSSNTFSKSYMDYMKVMKVVELGGLYLKDANNLMGFSALALKSLQNSKKPEISKASRQFDQKMDKHCQSVSTQLADVAGSLHKIALGLKQLKTGDYYFAKASVGFIEKAMPEIKSKLKDIEQSGDLNNEEITQLKSSLISFENAAKSINKALDAVPQSELVSVSTNESLSWSIFPAAYAASESNDYAKACSAVTQSSSDDSALKKLLKLSWKGIKNSFHGAQSVVGATADVVGVGMEAVSRVACGIYYKDANQSLVDNLGDSWEDIKTASGQIIENWKENKSGAQAMKDAQQFFEMTEDAADSLVSSGVTKMMGDGWTSWGLGKIAKITTGMFTGLGKGISMVANREAGAADLAVGMIEIASALTGGSKLVVKGSQVPAVLDGFADGAWITAKKTATLVKKCLLEVEEAGLEKSLVQLAKKGIITSSDDAAELLAKKAVLKSLSTANSALSSKLRELAKTSVKAVAKNASTSAKGSLNELVEQQFEASIKGLAKAMATTAGGSTVGYADNLAGSVMDNVIKDIVVQAIASDSTLISSGVDGVYKGAFSGGASGGITIVINGKSVTGSLSGKHSDGVVSGSIRGGYDSASGAISCSLSGSLKVSVGGQTRSVPFSGSLSGGLGGTSASGSWSTSTEFGSASGSWKASK